MCLHNKQKQKPYIQSAIVRQVLHRGEIETSFAIILYTILLVNVGLHSYIVDVGITLERILSH